MSSDSPASKVTISNLHARKKKGHKISALTAYDYPTALLEDQAGVDLILVGDSLGTNVLGYSSPQQVTMDDMLHHTRAVRRGVQRAFLLADLPFMSYQPSVERAMDNAARLLQEGGAEGVKIEGGTAILPQVEALAQAGIPTVGHLGFTPQSSTRGFYLYSERRGTVPKFHGKGPLGAKSLLDEARRLEDSGVFSLVLEMVTEEAAQAVSENLAIPVIGIGSGRYCDGQILIVNDLMGLNSESLLIAKSYASLRGELAAIFQSYRREVEGGLFPTADHTVHMDGDSYQKLQKILRNPPR